MLQITRREAQALATIASRLHRKPFTRRVRPDDMLEMILHLGMIQLDTISVVSRAHETAMFSRFGAYDLRHWTALFTERKALTEYMTHAAAITPVAYVPLVRGMMDRYAGAPGRWIDDAHNAPVAAAVMARVREEGALSSRDFEAPPESEQTGQWESWYGNKPERRALANLWYSGELLVSLRDGSFGRWFDLPERVAPEHWHLEPLPREEVERTLVMHSMRALGVGTAKWVTDYWRTGNLAYVPNRDVRRLLKMLSAEGVIVPVQIPGVDSDAWIDASMLSILETLRTGNGWPTRTTVLSPFDNLIWNRDRMKKLWGMDYTIEIYTPAARRQYGYYTMPILHRGALVGRIDPSLDRKRGVLTIRSLHLQPGVKATAALGRAIAKSLDEFTVFLGGSEWNLVRCEPEAFAAQLV